MGEIGRVRLGGLASTEREWSEELGDLGHFSTEVWEQRHLGYYPCPWLLLKTGVTCIRRIYPKLMLKQTKQETYEKSIQAILMLTVLSPEF